MAEVRLIDANALDALEDLEYIYHPVCDGDAWYRAEDVWKCIGEQPTIDPESLRPMGHWKNGVCTACKFDLRCLTDGENDLEQWVWDDGFDYCPNCGAKMEG